MRHLPVTSIHTNASIDTLIMVFSHELKKVKRYEKSLWQNQVIRNFSIDLVHIEIIYKTISRPYRFLNFEHHWVFVLQIIINNDKKLFMDHVSYYLQYFSFLFSYVMVQYVLEISATCQRRQKVEQFLIWR